ncbi:MAG TPA: methyltransferase domain-containing protein [Terriglobia bacterium]|nr:methyltransferase domain-containing protein [Terriglobia bacterium]
MSDTSQTEKLREEFNRWAQAGHGEEMESHHLPIVLPMLPLMKIGQREAILDVGCGAGWLCRMLASQISQGRVVGLDVSNEMIDRARAANSKFSNLTFAVGGVDRIPAPDSSFTRVVSVESAYYWPDPEKGIQEIFRVLAPGGSAWILINYYRDNPHCHQWGAQYAIPSHLLWADEWADLSRRAGLTSVEHRRIPDESPTPEVYTGRWFRDAEQMRKFKQEGALLVTGVKPAPASAGRPS